MICSVGDVCAAYRLPVGPVRSVPESRDLLRRAMGEIAELARACGVALPADAVARGMAIADSLPAEATSSLQRDLAAGVPSELEEWSGAAVRLGAEVGVEMAVQSFVYAVLVPGEQSDMRRRRRRESRS